MNRVRRRRPKDARGLDRPPIDVELALGIDPSAYDWRLSRLFARWAGVAYADGDTDRARADLGFAREHETRMWDLYPGGPETVRSTLPPVYAPDHVEATTRRPT